MIDGKKVLAVIPARGGSKGIPQKNIKLVAGKPLIAWTIEEAKKSCYIDRLILSSDDEKIIEVAKEWGCEVPFVRPRVLAMDDTPGIEPVLHAIEAIGEQYDYLVLLQPTSPLRTAMDIDGCIADCINGGAFTCVSITEPGKSPFWMYTVKESGQLEPFTKNEHQNKPRQKLPKVYVLNGAVYVADIKWLLSNKAFVTEDTLGYNMPTERSLDIDTPVDLLVAEYLLSEGISKNS